MYRINYENEYYEQMSPHQKQFNLRTEQIILRYEQINYMHTNNFT